MRVLILALLLAAPAALAQEKAHAPDYANPKCPLMKGRNAKPQYALMHDGQTVRFCCKRCLKKAAADPAAAVKAAYGKPKAVKNERCPVTGKAAKDQHTVTWQGHVVRLATAEAKKGFLKEPKLHLTLALNPKLKVHATKTCPVMEGEPVIPDCFVVWRGHAIRMCCEECVPMFIEDPATFEDAVKLPKQKKG